MLCYYVVLAVSVFVAFGTFLTNDTVYYEELEAYLTCEAVGQYPGKEECDRSRIDSFVFPILLNVTIYMYIAIPMVTLVYVISWRDVRKLIGKIFTFLGNKSDMNTVNTVVN